MLKNWYSLANQISRNERLVDSKSRRCKWEDLPDRLPPSFASPFIRLKGGNITHANEEHEIRKGQRSGARTSMSRIFDETGETDSFFFGWIFRHFVLAERKLTCGPILLLSFRRKDKKQSEQQATRRRKRLTSKAGCVNEWPCHQQQKGRQKKNVATDANSISLTSGPDCKESLRDFFKRNLLARK